MRRFRRAICFVLTASMVTGDLGRIALAEGIPFFKRSRTKTCLERAAVQVDRLERELNETGTVVIKAPDIWGESRLTKHRQEFEREMEKQISEFQLLLNANIRRSDQAYLASALAIQAAVGPNGASPEAGGAAQTFVNSLTTGTVVDKDGKELTSTDNPPIARTNIYTGTTAVHGFTGFDGNGAVGLEPTIRLDEMKRYLDHLHEIRRVNEGDDTSDSPGYSLNLVRIPVSLLPGELTRKGHGAEVTITAKPHISPELLPKVYRDLVINDLVDSLSLSMVKISEKIDTFAYELDEHGRPSGALSKEWLNLHETTKINVVLWDQSRSSATESAISQVQHTAEVYNAEALQEARGFLSNWSAKRVIERTPPGSGDTDPATPNNSPTMGGPNFGLTENEPPQDKPYLVTRKVLDKELAQYLESQTTQAIASASAGMGALARNARQPVSQSQVDAAFGRDQLLILGYEFWKGSARNHRNLLDARSFLKDMLDSGFDYLQLEANASQWDACPQIHQTIRSDDRESIDVLRGGVLRPYKVRDNQKWKEVLGASSPISSAAWLVLVESSLLNSQLNDDLQRVSQDPDCNCQCRGMTYEFFRPQPSEDAKMAFVDYVNCRWPIHVFALDPVVQQQNIADQFSMRREMQLALALAFSSGKIGAQSMTRYARRLELDMETIALNKTDVAFGHGSDTFGWRFTPRVQTPPFESNAKVVCRDLVRGGPSRDDLRKTWELEAGQRECTAIVLMPSFIDHMTFESRGNYFRLTDCHLDVLDHHDLNAKVAQDVRWSQQMQELNCLLEQIQCEQAHFLPGEINRVSNRIEQLSRKLPMQTVHARVPNENTMGGFEMFSSGVTDMAPELIGFYGEPGVNPKEDTVVYLVGKNFSVHDTHVLAGNHDCEFSLISREVMKVTIPNGVRTDAATRGGTECDDYVVDVHIATPYGVTSHLELPVLDIKEQTVQQNAWGRSEITMLIKYKYDSSTKVVSYPAGNTFTKRPHELPITAPPFGVTAALADLNWDVLWDDGLGVRKLGTTVGLLSNVPFSSSKESYVLTGTQYQKFLADTVAQVTTALGTSSLPPDFMDLIISGKIGGKDIAGDLHIMIRFEQIK